MNMMTMNILYIENIITKMEVFMIQKFLPNNYNHIFYSVIGNHAGETVEEIIERKENEITECEYSLWSAKIDKKSIEQVWKLDENDKVYVLCKINKAAKDPVKATIVPYYAKKAYGPDKQELTIPDGIKTSFTEGKNYQAYVVKHYELLESPIAFDFGKYESLLANNLHMSFKNRFKCNQFQNTYGHLNKQLEEREEKEIKLIMELKYPFVVNLE